MANICNNCGGIDRNGSGICPNCLSSTVPYEADTTWYNRYASEKMTEQEAIDFFETDKY